MSIKSSTIVEGTVVVLEPKGSLIGGSETDELKSTISALLEQGKLKLIIDLADVTYLNSSAIGVLTVAHSTFAARNGKMILCNVNKNITNIFIVTKLSTIFLTEDKREDAIFAIGK